jgi:hypothetical protein
VIGDTATPIVRPGYLGGSSTASFQVTSSSSYLVVVFQVSLVVPK